MPTTNQAAFKYQVARRKRMGEYRICKQCHKTFYLIPCRVKRNEQFCSPKCRLNSLNIEKVCPICGNIFRVLAKIADRYTVCSWQCRKHIRKDYICQTCNQPFQSSEIRWKPRFCSVACYRRSRNETNLERIIREAFSEMNVQFIQEAKIGRYSIDFYFPGYWIALEVDGSYWHRDKARDQRKTTYLEQHGIKVVRITESEIQQNNLHDLLRFRLGKYLQLI